MKRESAMLLGGWLALATLLICLGRQNLSSPGLYYDEAVYGGLARDFLLGQPAGGHMPGVSTAPFFGRPFPVFVQLYLGALKCWLLIPVFKLCGSTLAVLRGVNLLLSAAALLLFMLWTWRLLGLAEALLAGLLLAVDPAFFFPAALDWGSLLPSLLCRFGGFLLVLLAWRRQPAGWAFAAGFILGLGFFNKIDFGVPLAGTAIAALCAYRCLPSLLAGGRRGFVILAALGFTIGAGPMFRWLPAIFRVTFAGGDTPHPSELAEKLRTHLAMYDGSYFYRLMDAGGMFHKMYEAPAPVWTPLGILVLLAALVLALEVWGSAPGAPARRTRIFLLLATTLTTLGVWLLPGAVRIHHTTLVYPFPHLLLAAAAISLWHRPWRNSRFQWSLRGTLVAALVLLALGQMHAIVHTERLMRDTGGRGWWSNAVGKFSDSLKNRSDLIVASMDWGFNEQLEFLARGPRLVEPFWAMAMDQQVDLPHATNWIYLVHAPEFSLFPFGSQFLANAAHDTNAVVQPWRDEQGRIVFYTLGFTAP